VSLFLAPIYSFNTTPAPGAVAFGGDEVLGYLVAYFTISYDGFIYHQTASNQRAVRAGAWCNPQVGMSDYECRATQLDTSRPVGTYGTWLDLATTAHTWGFAAGSGGRVPINTVYPDKEGSFLLEIRRKSDQVVVASGNVLIEMSGNA
jgi:hypothetical protein